MTRNLFKDFAELFLFSKFDLTLLLYCISSPKRWTCAYFLTLLLRLMLIEVLLSILMYQIEVQGGFALHVYIVELIKVEGEISFLSHENKHAGGNFSSKLISITAHLFSTLDYLLTTRPHLQSMCTKHCVIHIRRGQKMLAILLPLSLFPPWVLQYPRLQIWKKWVSEADSMDESRH